MIISGRNIKSNGFERPVVLRISIGRNSRQNIFWLEFWIYRPSAGFILLPMDFSIPDGQRPGFILAARDNGPLQCQASRS